METTSQKLNRLANESMQELIEMGFEEKLKNNNISFTISNAKRRLGQCVDKKYINISKWLLEIASDKEIKNTIIHEIIHTFEDTKGHNYKWKQYANKVNSFGVYNITRLANVQEIMNNNGINSEQTKDILNYRYEIKCKKCGTVYYKRRIMDNTMLQYKNHCRIHTRCGGKDFIVKDLKTNKIIVGEE